LTFVNLNHSSLIITYSKAYCAFETPIMHIGFIFSWQ